MYFILICSYQVPPPPDNYWRNTVLFYILHTHTYTHMLSHSLSLSLRHTHTVDGVCCLPETICCAGLRPGPASHHQLNGGSNVFSCCTRTTQYSQHNGISCPCYFTCMVTFLSACTDSAQIIHIRTVTYYTCTYWAQTRTCTGHMSAPHTGRSRGSWPRYTSLYVAFTDRCSESIYSVCLFLFSAVHLYAVGRASRDLGSEWASIAVLLSIEAVRPDNMDGREPQTEDLDLRWQFCLVS